MKLRQVKCPGCGGAWVHNAARVDWIKCTCGASYDPMDRPAVTPAPDPEHEDDPLMCELLGFLNDLTHPEQYGHAVTAEVRKRARELATAIETAEGMV